MDTVSPVRTVLGFWAHPDDKAHASFAPIAAVRREGERVVMRLTFHYQKGPDEARR